METPAARSSSAIQGQKEELISNPGRIIYKMGGFRVDFVFLTMEGEVVPVTYTYNYILYYMQ